MKPVFVDTFFFLASLNHPTSATPGPLNGRMPMMARF